jgi:hypothetical protein
MAIISCYDKGTNNNSANLGFNTQFIKVFRIIVVEDIERITPKKMQSICFQPIHSPLETPSSPW